MDNVELVSITKPLVDNITPEEFIVYVARVSNPDNQNNLGTAPKLIKYLIDHKHWSPFEHVTMTVEIETSRAIAAQILRHRSFSFQEFSQRYAKAVKIEDIELRKQAEKNRQSSTERFNPEIEDHIFPFEEKNEKHEWVTSWRGTDAEEYAAYAINIAKDAYERMIKKGVAKECARMVLPLATSTVIYMTGNVRSWIHYLEIRDDEHTQKEHREIAQQIKKIFIEKFPEISKALGWV